RGRERFGRLGRELLGALALELGADIVLDLRQRPLLRREPLDDAHDRYVLVGELDQIAVDADVDRIETEHDVDDRRTVRERAPIAAARKPLDPLQRQAELLGDALEAVELVEREI